MPTPLVPHIRPFDLTQLGYIMWDLWRNISTASFCSNIFFSGYWSSPCRPLSYLSYARLFQPNSDIICQMNDGNIHRRRVFITFTSPSYTPVWFNVTRIYYFRRTTEIYTDAEYLLLSLHPHIPQSDLTQLGYIFHVRWLTECRHMSTPSRH